MNGVTGSLIEHPIATYRELGVPWVDATLADVMGLRLPRRVQQRIGGFTERCRRCRSSDARCRDRCLARGRRGNGRMSKLDSELRRSLRARIDVSVCEWLQSHGGYLFHPRNVGSRDHGSLLPLQSRLHAHWRNMRLRVHRRNRARAVLQHRKRGLRRRARCVCCRVLRAERWRFVKIHECTMADGTLAPIELDSSDGQLSITDETGQAFVIPERALDVVMKRYGLPFDESEAVREVDQLPLPSTRVLRHIRHLGQFDVIAKDYLVLTHEGSTLCTLASTVSGVLLTLARR